MYSKTKKIVFASLIAAFTCVATLVIKIPSPLKGYLNLGDCIVLVAGWTLPCGYGFLAAGIGSALADLFSGYAIYAPVTFLIKGLMAVVVFLCSCCMKKRIGAFVSQIVGGIFAEIVMVTGYYVFEGFLYGFAPALVNISGNCMQGIAGLLIGLVLVKVFEKSGLSFR